MKIPTNQTNEYLQMLIHQLKRTNASNATIVDCILSLLDTRSTKEVETILSIVHDMVFVQRDPISLGGVIDISKEFNVSEYALIRRDQFESLNETCEAPLNELDKDLTRKVDVIFENENVIVTRDKLDNHIDDHDHRNVNTNKKGE